MSYDPFDASGSDDTSNSDLLSNPNFMRNLAAFGANMAVAANARTPQGFLAYGNGFAGPLGAAVLGAQQSGLANAQARTAIQGQQTENLKNRLSLLPMARQYNLTAPFFGAPQINMAGLMQGLPETVGQSSSGAPMASPMTSQMPTGGAGGPSQSGQPMGGMGISPRIQNGLAMLYGQKAPQSSDDYMMMAQAAYATGDSESARKLEDYAQSGIVGGMVQPGTKESPEFQGRVTAANAAANLPFQESLEKYKSDVGIQTVRGEHGSVAIRPGTGETWQLNSEIPSQDPQSGQKVTNIMPLGVTYAGPNGTRMIGGSEGQNPPVQNPGQGAFPFGGQSRPMAPQVAGALPGATTSFVEEIGPGQHEILSKAAENYAEEGKKAYESAIQMKGSLELLGNDIDRLGPQGFLTPGTAANLRGEFARALNTVSRMAGGGDVVDPSKVTAWEDFAKESTIGGMKGISALFGASKEAASIIHTGIGAFPQPLNSYEGAKFLKSVYGEAADNTIDRHIFETNWAMRHNGSLMGANEAFNQQYPAVKYSRRAISQIQPYVVNSPEDLNKYLPGTRITMKGKVDANGQPIVAIVPGPMGIQLNGAQQGPLQ